MTKKNKTQPSDASVEDYIASIEHPKRRRDSYTLLEIMKRLTAEEPKLWGPSIIGFGQYHYKYDSGREGDFMRTGFAPRKANMVVYIMPGYREYEEQLARLGKHKIGKSCLYLTDLEKVDINVLEEIIADSLKYMREKYPN
ncbi:MAG: DUF1801 domain-containing protein [Sphingomonadales bacterium]|jgi:hypothetical protein